MNTRTFIALQILLTAIAALALVLAAPGCATTWTAQSFRDDPAIDGAQISCQKTVVMAIGKAGIDSATPHASSERTPDRGHLLTSGSETTGLKSDEALFSAVLDRLVTYLEYRYPPTPLPVPELLR